MTSLPLRWETAILLIALAFAGCSQTRNGQDITTLDPSAKLPKVTDHSGVEVGNGLALGVVRHFPHYKIDVHYSHKLIVEGSDATSLVLANEKESTPEIPKSSLALHFFAAGKMTDGTTVIDIPSLLMYAYKAHPGKRFSTTWVEQLPGIVSESMTPDHYSALYYLTTPQNDIVSATVDAYQAGQGKELLLSVIHSLTYDNTPPVISSLTLKSVDPAEKTAFHLKLNAWDDGSGLNSKIALTFSRIERDSSGRIQLKRSFSQFANFQQEGDAFDVPVFNPNLKEGDYVITRILLDDNLGNELALTAKVKDGALPTNYEGSSVPIPLIQIHLKADLDSARYSSGALHVVKLWLEDPHLSAGGKGRLHFIADFGGGEPPPVAINWGSLTTVAFSHVTLPIYGVATKVGDSEYTIDFPIERWAPPGEYYLAKFNLQDAHAHSQLLYSPRTDDFWPLLKGTYYLGSNSPLIPFVKAQMTNTKTVDVTAPILFAFGSYYFRAKPGEKLVLVFSALDDASGVDEYLNVPVIWVGADSIVKNKLLAMNGPIRPLGENQYEMNLTIPSTALPGFYYLQAFHLRDRAGNFAVSNAPTCAGQTRFTGEERYTGTGVPLVFLDVEQP